MSYFYDDDSDNYDDRANLGQAIPKAETAKALLVMLASDLEDHWIPKSVIHPESECYSMKSGPGDLIVTFWFAEKEGLV